MCAQDLPLPCLCLAFASPLPTPLLSLKLADCLTGLTALALVVLRQWGRLFSVNKAAHASLAPGALPARLTLPVPYHYGNTCDASECGAGTLGLLVEGLWCLFDYVYHVKTMHSRFLILPIGLC